jgi:hypothetical protein
LQDTDSAGQKLGGALLNAIIFMAVIAGMTFVLFLLFKWGVSALWQQQQSSQQQGFTSEHCWKAVTAGMTFVLFLLFKWV